jgi:caffeoyl-CoA O-methyltransferase
LSETFLEDIVNPELVKYMQNLIPERDAVLREMEAYGAENDFPLIGPLCGRFLHQMARTAQARNIFEMGSGFGYSAIWFARGIPEDGKIICTDGDPQNKKRAMEYFERAGLAHKIEFHVGIAQEIIQKYRGPFDIILNDIDKHEYADTIDLVVPRLRKGGLFITDNVLWDGKVTAPPDDKYTRGVQEFNRLIYNRKDLLTTIVPLRDGLSVSVKL